MFTDFRHLDSVKSKIQHRHAFSFYSFNFWYPLLILFFFMGRLLTIFLPSTNLRRLGVSNRIDSLYSIMMRFDSWPSTAWLLPSVISSPHRFHISVAERQIKVESQTICIVVSCPRLVSIPGLQHAKLMAYQCTISPDIGQLEASLGSKVFSCFLNYFNLHLNQQNYKEK